MGGAIILRRTMRLLPKQRRRHGFEIYQGGARLLWFFCGDVGGLMGNRDDGGE